MKILLGDFNAKVGREEIYKPTFRKESLHEIINDNGVRVVNLVTSKNLTVRSTVPHIVVFINLLRHSLMERLAVNLTIFYRWETAFKCT
jgi:hypothetical protein